MPPPRAKKLASKILVLGSTGYIGTRLVLRLLNDGYKVRVTYRTKSKLYPKSWYNHPNLEAVRCDVFNIEELRRAVEDCDYAYYLIHSMGSDEDGYAKMDLVAAENMVTIANQSSLKKIIYLGGLGNPDDDLSIHLRSRLEVGQKLQESEVDVIMLRAAIIIGGGSLSFEIQRYLTEKLPLMITPKWVYQTLSQPISVLNVIEYLIGSMEVDAMKEGSYDIGGPDILSYADMFQIHAQIAGLHKRVIIPVPVLTPNLSSRWIRLMTPVDEKIATSLVDGLRNDAVCLNDHIKDYIPQKLLTVRDAIKRALYEKQHTLVRDAYGYKEEEPPIEWSQPGDPSWAGGPLFYDRRIMVIKDADGRSKLWNKIVSIGGDNGWYYLDFLWKIRGFIDELLGGPGMRRGRESPDTLEAGDVLDCWRVVRSIPGEELALRAEMKIFGIGTMKFKITSGISTDQFIIEQHASYVPKGLAGYLYWYSVAPLHNLVFKGMLEKLVQGADVKVLLGPKLVPTTKEVQSGSQFIPNL